MKCDFIFKDSDLQINCLEVGHLKKITPATKSDIHVKGQTSILL